MNKQSYSLKYRTPEDRKHMLLAQQAEVDRTCEVKNKAQEEYRVNRIELENNLNELFFDKLERNQKSLVDLMGKFYAHNLRDRRAVLLMEGKNSIQFDKNWDNRMKDAEWSFGIFGYVYKHDYSWLPYRVGRDTIHSVNEHGVVLQFADKEYLVPFAFFDASVTELTQFFRKRRSFLTRFIEQPEELRKKEVELHRTIAKKREALALMQKELEELENSFSAKNSVSVKGERVTESTHE